MLPASLPGSNSIEINIEDLYAYQDLEKLIDNLVDFAAEIRENEPTWGLEK